MRSAIVVLLGFGLAFAAGCGANSASYSDVSQTDRRDARPTLEDVVDAVAPEEDAKVFVDVAEIFDVSDGGEDSDTPSPPDVDTLMDVLSPSDVPTDASTDAGEPPEPLEGDFVVIAWNDLGMHCLNPTYDKLVILPPYNTVWAQVLRRDAKPGLVTEGLTVSYRVVNNTYSYGKIDALGADFAQFWDFAEELFGVALTRDLGLNLDDPAHHNGLEGTMVVRDDHFEVHGVPVTPVDDDGAWNPYQTVEVVARDLTGRHLATTRTTIPTSDEITCGACHGSETVDPFDDILTLHGRDLPTMQPVLCAQCHGSPALGTNGVGSSGRYLSEVVHSFHATADASCYDCHPGPQTQCSRSLAHTGPDGNCTECHGSVEEVGASIASGARIPWVQEPKCVDCHDANVPDLDTGATLYRMANGHGDMPCAACHGSPHAQTPSRRDEDNQQFVALQGRAVSLGSCGVCHSWSRGRDDLGDFSEKHAGLRPDIEIACHVCHTSVTATPTSWPHAYEWTNRETGLSEPDD